MNTVPVVISLLNHRNQTIEYDKTWKSLEFVCRIVIRPPQVTKYLTNQEKTGRGEKIRTSGPCLPKAVLYQAELHPDEGVVIRVAAWLGKSGVS